jgi:predicted DNA-binding protein
MGIRKISTTVYLTSEQDAALRELSRVTKVPTAVFIREAVDLFLRHRIDGVEPRQAPLCPNPSHSEACCK